MSGPPPTSVDSTLHPRLIAGDEAVFKIVFDTYWTPLCAFAFRYVHDRELAEDIVQSVFVRLAQQRSDWNPHTSLKAYLYAATRNAAFDSVRRAEVRTRAADTPGTLDSFHPSSPNADTATHASEIARALQDAMQALTPRVRLVAMHRWYDGLTRTEIATLLGVSEETIHKQLSTALVTLRARLQHLR